MENAFADLAAQLSSEIEFEFEKGLIVSVRSYRCLFAINHEQYHNTVHNKVAWQQISNCLKKSVLDCINRWYTLVQTFLYYYQKSLSSKEPITWPHYEALQELRPAMVTEYTDLIETKKPPIFYAKSNATQREELLNELIANRLKLLSSETPIEQVQKIWATLADKLNNMGPRMPIIKWQRCWWEMKTRFKKQIWQIQMRQQSKVGSRLTEFLSEEDMKIMKFCGANVLHSYSSSIAVVLDSYIEFGSNRDKPIPRCRKCTIFLKDVTCDLCDACLKFPNKCDICLQMFELELVFYQLKDWSLKAKSLLPTSYHTYAELAMCTNCSDALQKESATTWKVCRVCEKNHQVLDNLFSSTNDHLRDVFRKATNITIKDCRIYLSTDGFEVSDEDYFQSLEPQTLFIVGGPDQIITTDSDFEYEKLRQTSPLLKVADIIYEFIERNPEKFKRMICEYEKKKPQPDTEKTHLSLRSEHSEWFEGQEERCNSKEEAMSRRAQDRIRSYYYKTKDELTRNKLYRSNAKARVIFDRILEKFRYLLIGCDYFSMIFDRSCKKKHEFLSESNDDTDETDARPLPNKRLKQIIKEYTTRNELLDEWSVSLCTDLGDFYCQGPYSENQPCGKDHCINPYASRENLILFQVWNLDHQIELSRTILPSLIENVRDLVENPNQKCPIHKKRVIDISVLEYFLEIFSLKNLKLVHIVCHEKVQRSNVSNGRLICENCHEYKIVKELLDVSCPEEVDAC